MEQMLLKLGGLMPKLWEMSFAGGIVILVVLGARILLRRAPKIFSYVLWGVVLFRLLCPVSVSTSVSLFGLFEVPRNEAADTLPQENVTGMPQYPGGLHADNTQQQMTGEPAQTQASNTEAVVQSQSAWAQKNVWIGVIWLAGLAVVLLYGSRGYISLRKNLRHAKTLRQNVYETERIETPFVLGIVSPKIYLPRNLTEQEQEYIILHERTHIMRGDHVSRLLFFLALAIHWFNPLAWVAFYLSEKDMEMSCDETVLKAMDEDIRAAYATSLLTLAIGRRRFAGIPLAFGESDTKARVKNIMRYRKPAIGVAVVAALVVGLLVVALGSNPTEQEAALTDEVIKDKETQALLEALEEMEGYEGEIETQKEAAVKEVEVYEAVGKWAEAFCNRDAETIIAMCGEKALESLAQSVQLETYDGQATMGYSSPWPWSDEADYEICFATDSTAEILYYAWTSDPHVTVWRETLTYHKEGSEYVIDEEKLIWLDAISSGVEYMEAYLEGITGSRMDYQTNGAGAGLNDNAKANPGLAGYSELFEPETAARYLLNLLDNPNKVLLTAEAAGADGSVRVEIQFLEDGGSVWVTMQQPYGEDGIWLVNGHVMGAGNDLATGGVENGRYKIGVRTVSVEHRCIDSYVQTGTTYSGISVSPIYFAEDCVFAVNPSMNGLQEKEVSFAEFASYIEEGTEGLNWTCWLAMQDGEAVEALLLNTYETYGIRCDWAAEEDWYKSMQDELGKDFLAQYYTLADTKEAELAAIPGKEKIEVYIGNTGDGESGLVLVKDADGNLLHSECAHTARTPWRKVYLGEDADGNGFLFVLCIEERDTYGSYSYEALRMDADGRGATGVEAASQFAYGGAYVYDDALFEQWVAPMENYLENSTLLLGIQDGEVRVNGGSEADIYNYETLRRKD